MCIDEVGYRSYSNRHADLLFELTRRRYGNKSTLITTNKPFAQWKNVFPNPACIVSLIDRLIHNAEIVAPEGSARARRAPRAAAAQGQAMTRSDSAPTDLPLDDIHIDIALDWSPAQALAAYEWLDIVRDRIWLLYGHDIVRFLRSDATPTTGPSAGADDPPF